MNMHGPRDIATHDGWPRLDLPFDAKDCAIILGDLQVLGDDRPNLSSLLGRIAIELDGAVAIIDEVPADQLRQLGASGSITLIGSLGAEAVVNGEVEPFLASPPFPEDKANLLEQFFGHVIGVEVDYRPELVTVRLAEGAKLAAFVDGVLRQVIEGMEDTHYLLGGEDRWHILPRDLGKEKALRRLMMFSPFAERRPLFIGTQYSDLPAVQVAAELGGWGCRVGTPSPDCGATWFREGSDVVDWLCAVAEGNRPAARATRKTAINASSPQWTKAPPDKTGKEVLR